MGGRILIVDDEPYILRIVSFKLRRAGYTTLEARSAEEAEDLIAGNTIDLMVLDVGLASSTNGFDLAARLREQEKTRNLPIIILTASGFSSDVLRGRQVGAAGYVTKPFSSEELVERIRAILD